MGRILHLSDLHFGRHRPELPEPLLQLAARLAPDVTVISGDLTQRARQGEWQAARALIARLPQPVIAVPGNHDMPLYNLAARLIRPFGGYRTHVSADLEPVVETPDLMVLGLNTADPWVWQRGLIRPASLLLMRRRLARARPGQLRVAVLHHPLITPAGTGKTPMQDAETGAEALAEAGADLVLCGHLHLWAADPYAIRKGARSILCVQAGTTLSTRLRGEDNDLNVIDVSGGIVTVTRWHTAGDRPEFRPDQPLSFVQDAPATGWLRRP